VSETKEVPNELVLSTKITSRLLTSTLKLFNAIPIDEAKKEKPSKKLTELTLNHGFIFSPQVIGNYKEKELIEIIELVSNEIGLSPSQMNSSFHKSWKKVRDAPMYQLLMEQLFHYITTYGYESIGVYDQNTVFIPNERLDVPGISGETKLAIVKGYTIRQLKTKLLTMLESGIALDNIDDIIEVSKYCKVGEKDIEQIKNKEVRIRLYKNLNLLPEEPIEFLRLVLFETGNELLINNKKTRETIRKSDVKLVKLFELYDKQYGYNRLAQIFLRFKDLFLSFRVQDPNLKPIINKISNLSKKYHVALTPSLLNDVTGLLKQNKKINTAKLRKELDNANIFRKIRLLHALHYRTLGVNTILYKIRNGKSYATDFEFSNTKGAKEIYELVLKSISYDLRNLKGKKIYIPSNITYSLPATAKQFTGNIPSGSYVTVPKDMIFGVNWNNVKGNRIDLDLSVISINNGKIGWDARYRGDGASILFSGDMTDAQNGASELFYINKDFEDIMMMYVNYFNYNESIPVPVKVVVAQEHANSFGQNYMIDPNNIQCIAKTEINTKQKILGLIVIKKGECRFYFSETSLGDKITSGGGDNNNKAREYLVNYMTNMVTLNDILESVGVELVDKVTKDCIDLSPEVIEKDSFIKLLTG